MRTPSTDRIDQLALVWLLVPRQKSPESELAKQLRNVAKGAADAERLASECVARLRQRGMLQPSNPLKLTEEGSRVALDALGVSGIPEGKKLDWAKKLLLLRSIGADAAGVSTVGQADAVAARIVSRRYKIDRNASPLEILAILARRALGLENGTSFSFDDAFIAVCLEGASISSPDEEGGASSSHPSSAASLKLAECKLPDFASTVIDAARSSVTGRWHDAVFISHVWKTLRARGDVGITFKDFQRRLIEAHQDELVELSRADLVEAMPAADVSASETVHSGARFHFIRVEQLAS